LDRVFTDKASGRDTSRPELTELLRFARDGDTVVVHSMDRLARNLDDLRALVQGLTRKGVRVEFVKESLVKTTTVANQQLAQSASQCPRLVLLRSGPTAPGAEPMRNRRR
jgi:DNA invertase Pin-like site-specific DNA recombinase